jgi:hypothetical protein
VHNRVKRCAGRSEKVVELESSTSKVAELQIGQSLYINHLCKGLTVFLASS